MQIPQLGIRTASLSDLHPEMQELLKGYLVNEEVVLCYELFYDGQLCVFILTSDSLISACFNFYLTVIGDRTVKKILLEDIRSIKESQFTRLLFSSQYYILCYNIDAKTPISVSFVQSASKVL